MRNACFEKCFSLSIVLINCLLVENDENMRNEMLFSALVEEGTFESILSFDSSVIHRKQP